MGDGEYRSRRRGVTGDKHRWSVAVSHDQRVVDVSFAVLDLLVRDKSLTDGGA